MALKTNETGYRPSVTTPERQRRFATPQPQGPIEKDTYQGRRAERMANMKGEAPRSGLLQRFRDFVLGPSLFTVAPKENVSRFNSKAQYVGEVQLVSSASKRLEHGIQSKSSVPTDNELYDIINYVKKHG